MFGRAVVYLYDYLSTIHPLQASLQSRHTGQGLVATVGTPTKQKIQVNI